jgi:pyruvate/2-oxoglutarate dehydrogenase complex dihydrolipoamide acyltransferase (E2) component
MARPHDTRGRAGRFTNPIGIHAHLTSKEPRMTDVVIASETKIVHDPLLDIDRQVVAGQPVPPDLVDAYNAEGGTVADPQAASAPTEDLASKSVPELQALADERGIEVEGTGKDGNVLKDDLVKALSATS